MLLTFIVKIVLAARVPVVKVKVTLFEVELVVLLMEAERLVASELNV